MTRLERYKRNSNIRLLSLYSSICNYYPTINKQKIWEDYRDIKNLTKFTKRLKPVYITAQTEEDE